MGSYDQKIKKLNELAGLLKEQVFETARLQPGRVLLQRSDGETVIEYPCAAEDRVNGIRIHLIRKELDTLFFTLSCATDDEWGLMYTPTNRVDLSQVIRVERVEPRWFTFARV